MRSLRILAICCLITLMFSGCGSPGPSSLAEDEDITVAQDEVPFTILIPGHLPPGYIFSEVRVDPPPAVTAGPVRAVLMFTDDDDGYLEITQSDYSLQLDDYTDVIDLSETTTAQLHVRELADGRTWRELAFSSHEVGIIVSAADLSRAELIKVAESLLKD